MKTDKILLAGLLGLTTSLTAFFASALPSLARPATIDIEANVRSGPSFQSTRIDGLPKGTNVEVSRIIYEAARKDHWYYVRSTGRLKTQGWVSSDLVRFAPSNATYGTLIGQLNGVINIRLGPSLKDPVQHMGVFGDLVRIKRSQFVPDNGSRSSRIGYDWHNIVYPNGATGWVRGDLIQVWPKGCIITCPEY